jgi:hypothetical protein
MREHVLGVVLIVTAVPALATPQTTTKFDVGPVVRAEQIGVEGVTQVMAVFGVAASARLSRIWGLEGEIAQSDGREFSHSREGISESFAPAGATWAEVERLGVLARWRYGYRPGLGGTVAVTARGTLNRHTDLLFRLGLATRSYTQSYEYSVLSIPDGIDPRRLAGHSFGNGERSGNPYVEKTQRGGLLMGAEVPIRIGTRLSVAPEVRYVYGGSARFDDKHQEVGLGVRAGWAF